jgi:hypothetical protein
MLSRLTSSVVGVFIVLYYLMLPEYDDGQQLIISHLQQVAIAIIVIQLLSFVLFLLPCLNGMPKLLHK